MSGARAHAPPWGLKLCVFAGALWRNSVCLEVGAPFLAGCFSMPLAEPAWPSALASSTI